MAPGLASVRPSAAREPPRDLRHKPSDGTYFKLATYNAIQGLCALPSVRESQVKAKRLDAK